MAPAVDWSGLVRDILELIVRRLITVSDNLTFSAVCSSWRSVAVKNRCYLPHKYPGLIFPGSRIKKSKTRHYLQPVPESEYYYNNNDDMNKTPEIVQVPHRYYSCGSSLGWLVLIDNHFIMQLFNQLTTVKVFLVNYCESATPIIKAAPSITE
ncbi:hypothetical protein FRX31_010867 [Thalictrum thalictroides]|uniref:F-box protein n=1 Tax=Thalictrum thalictroides TaxID=46969 RepID=A0A7J6WSV9_THATH|nr:hypothetical protein FRX31_010867 [Thalictrum thalictroides]